MWYTRRCNQGGTAPLLGIPEMNGPTITMVPVRVQWEESTLVMDLLNQIHSQSTSMIPHSHLRLKNIEALSSDCKAACGFQNILVVQPEQGPQPTVPGMRLIQITDTQYPSYGLAMQCMTAPDELGLVASYDSPYSRPTMFSNFYTNSSTCCTKSVRVHSIKRLANSML